MSIYSSEIKDPKKKLEYYETVFPKLMKENEKLKEKVKDIHLAVALNASTLKIEELQQQIDKLVEMLHKIIALGWYEYQNSEYTNLETENNLHQAEQLLNEIKEGK